MNQRGDFEGLPGIENFIIFMPNFTEKNRLVLRDKIKYENCAFISSNAQLSSFTMAKPNEPRLLAAPNLVSKKKQSVVQTQGFLQKIGRIVNGFTTDPRTRNSSQELYGPPGL